MKKIVSLILILCIFSTMLSSEFISAFAVAQAPSVSIINEGEIINSLIVPENEKRTITAQCTPDSDNYDYQWQILLDAEEEQWVDIYDAKEASLDVSYALIASVMDAAKGSYLRCLVSNGDVVGISNSIGVTIAFNAETAASFSSSDSAIALMSANADGSVPVALAEDEYVYVTINYLDAESGDPIYSPYVAKLEKNTEYHQEVTSPTFLGYAPFWNDEDYDISIPADGTEVNTPDTASVLNLNIAQVSEDVVINVYYKAIDVSYAIRYFFQNIIDDLYTENTTLYYTGKAKTGTIITEQYIDSLISEEHKEGFSLLYHHPDSVSADSSTVFECYYDREYYLLKFDMDGGYGVDPVYARYGTPFIINNPEKPGYVFNGWDLLDANGKGDGVADTPPMTIPAENQSYKALWGTKQTSYSVVYWLEDADIENTYSYIGSTVKSAQSGDSVDGSDDLISGNGTICGQTNHTHTNECYLDMSRYVFESADQDVIIDGDGSTTVNVYYTRKQYTLRFYYARSSGTGDAKQYQVVGGSTYPFGKYGSNNENTSIETLLANVSNWGSVTGVPQLKSDKASKYTQGQVKYVDDNITYDYYYFEFTVPYGASIGDIWPVDVFDPVSVDNTLHSSHSCPPYAYFSAWNGEYRVKYSQEKSNQTIKGKYYTLDDAVLFASSFKDEQIVSYLGFWENGADVGWSVPEEYIYNIYVEAISGNTYELKESYPVYDDSNIGGQTETGIEGFTFDYKNPSEDLSDEDYGTKDVDGYTIKTTEVNFYYSRNDYKLSFYNYNSYVSDKTDIIVPYGTPLSNYNFTPAYPSNMEENAYYFDGWYTTPECYERTKVDFTNDTMPASDLTLYAKWSPKIHKVNFFDTYDEMLAYEAGASTVQPHYIKEVEHGKILGSVENPDHPTGDTNYVFAGWFYMSGGQKVAYTPLDMPVNRDLNIFADWSSHSAQPYRINYVLDAKEGDGAWLNLISAEAGDNIVDNTVVVVSNGAEERQYVYLTADNGWHLSIADSTNGYGYQGSTRTFNAKAGDPYNQLYEKYNTGYFPTLASHSITMQYEEDKLNPKVNTFTFTYVQASNIAYKVRYVDKNTGLDLADPDTGITSAAIVTARFKVIEDRIPDAFYKRLVIAVEKDENGNWVGSEDNVIIFYYTPNDTAAYYAVHFMMQKLGDEYKDGNNYAIDGSGDYEETETHIEGIGTIGDKQHITPINFDGFTLIESPAYAVVGGNKDNKSETSLIKENNYYEITIEQEGTELYIFYERNEYPYNVKYLEYGTGNELKTEKNVSGAQFGSTVTENAEVVDGYYCVNDSVQSIVIRSDKAQNEIIFYYSPLQYTAEYIVVDGVGGSLDYSKEVKTGKSEFTGAIATADSGYEFDGWYLDEECTIQATDKATVNGNQIIPKIAKLDPMPALNRYYAKFNPLYGSLTINRYDFDDEGNGNQVFTYKIVNVDNPDSVIYVTVEEGKSTTITDLLYGEYTITQIDEWSWRSGEDNTVTVKLDSAEESTDFTDEASNSKWLNGNSGMKVNTKGGS